MKIVSKDSTRKYERDGIVSYLLASEITTNAKNITTTLVEMQPHGFQKPHTHSQEQCYFIISGEGEMTVGNEVEKVKSGDCIHVPSNELHGLKNVGSKLLQYYSAASPSLKMEELLTIWSIE